MFLNQTTNNKLLREVFLIILIGSLSFVMGLVKFYIPGLEGSGSDFREIPLLIGIFYVSNPISLIIISAITSLGAISINSFWPTFISHSVGLVIYWYFYQYLKTKTIGSRRLGAIWFFSTFGYFLAIVIPLIVYLNFLFGLNHDITIWAAYKKFVLSIRFEALSTSLASSLFLTQHKIRAQLNKHKKNLEATVQRRTQQLQESNHQLNKKSKIIHDQNEELRTTLSNLKAMQSHLLQTEKMASIGTLTAGVAHEINNPLNYIIGGYWGLTKYFEEVGSFDSEKTSILLDSIKIGADRAADIVQGLSNFSSDGKSFDEECDINLIIDNCLALLSNMLKHRVQISKEYSYEKCIIKGNSSKIHQAIVDIITNASQAITNDGLIKIKTSLENHQIKIVISDNGCGISKENITQISDPFFTTKEAGEGTGLGLSTVYAIIKEHNGRINFESEPEKGTTVTILLPQ